MTTEKEPSVSVPATDEGAEREKNAENAANLENAQNAEKRETSGQQTGIEFTGSATEYFGIWIVNLILSIITLGIYSAWAKVRRETYFNNNTRIFETGFGYHATGGQILKGRLIIFGVLVGVNIISSFQPVLWAVVIIIFPFLLPWILNSSLRFSARMTSFRNIRFNWHGTYWKTMWFLVIAPSISFLSLGLLLPLISKHYYTYFACSHSYGTARFSANPNVRDFYLAFLLGAIIPAVALGCIVLALLTSLPGLSDQEMAPGIPFIWAFGASSFFYAFLFSMAFIYSVLCRNLMVKSLTLENVLTFDSQINPLKFIWISLSNLVLTLLSLSLLLPWAKVRMYRYLSGVTFVTAIGDIEGFIDEANSSKSSLGEAAADFEGVEVSI